MVAHEWQIFYRFFTFCSIYLLIILVFLLFCSIYPLIILVLVYQFSNITIVIFSQRNCYQKKICFVEKKIPLPIIAISEAYNETYNKAASLTFLLITTALHFTCGEKIIEMSKSFKILRPRWQVQKWFTKNFVLSVNSRNTYICVFRALFDFWIFGLSVAFRG